MAILVGSARQDEKGRYSGGTAGDQTGKEVSTQEMYTHSKGWYIIRAKDIVHANKIAERMFVACENNNIGYDQNQRLGIIQNGINTKLKTECDCSSLVRQCVREATGKDPGNFTTANELQALKNTGLFEKEISYVNQIQTPVYDGDILVTKSKGHTVIVVSGNRRKTNNVVYYPKCDNSLKSIVEALKQVKEPDVSLNNRKIIAHKNGINNYTGTAQQNTTLLNLLKQGTLIKP